MEILRGRGVIIISSARKGVQISKRSAKDVGNEDSGRRGFIGGVLKSSVDR